jgi:6-phosphofructokinase
VQIDKCFGFDTAVEEAQRALLAAKVEAVSGYRGLGIVKLMGRSSGFIAMQASMASGGLLLLSFVFAFWANMVGIAALGSMPRLAPCCFVC